MNDSPPSPPAPVPSLTAEPENSSRVVLACVLGLLCILVRGQGLLALPMFSDEAIYLRWAQLVRAGHGWVSLIDPKPPLHFWLLAGVFGWAKEPLLAARGLSVCAGVLSIPAIMLVCEEVGLLHPVFSTRRAPSPPPTGRILGLLAAVLMIFCPFLAFYQRLATADALFVLETLVATWLGLRWGRRAVTGLRAWPSAIAVGIAFGAAMMTRQGLSYTLWGMPLAGVAVHFSRGLSGKRWATVLSQFILAALIATCLWMPYLTHDLARTTENARADAPAHPADISEWTVIKQRILYQEQFTQSETSRVALAAHNAASAGEWFFDYLTWPVCAASVLGLVAMGLRRQWRMLLVLLLWVALMLGPVIILGNVLYSRYALAAVPPLLIAAGYFVAELLSFALASRFSPVFTWSAAGVMLAAIILLPLRQLALQATSWWQQTLTVADRAQYITGWTSGLSTRKALTFIEGYAAGGKVVLITDDGWGLPADAAWVTFDGSPMVQVYYKNGATESPLLTPGPALDTFMLRKDKWLYTPAEPVRLPPDATVLFLTKTSAGDETLLHALQRFTPNLKPVLSFYGIDNGADHVVLFEVK